MASLSVFQVLQLNEEKNEKPIISSISGDAMTLIVASTLNLIHVYRRESLSDKFQERNEVYTQHKSSNEITALAIQDGGAHAVSGDSSGAIHIWQTDNLEENARYKLNKGRITAISVSTKYILACFSNEPTNKTKMLLIRKGLNLKEKLLIEKEFDGDVSYSRCSLSEHGKPATPHVMYVNDGNLVLERPLQKHVETSRITLPYEVVPWYIRRNTGAGNMFVISAASLKDIILWAPLHGGGEENPIKLRMTSEDSLRLNMSLVMSSVVSSSMFMTSIYEEKVSVFKVIRENSTRFVRDPSKSEAVKPLNMDETKFHANNCKMEEINTQLEEGENKNHSNNLQNQVASQTYSITSFQRLERTPTTIQTDESQHQVEQDEVVGFSRGTAQAMKKTVHEDTRRDRQDLEKGTNSTMSGSLDIVDSGSCCSLDRKLEPAAVSSDIAQMSFTAKSRKKEQNDSNIDSRGDFKNSAGEGHKNLQLNEMKSETVECNNDSLSYSDLDHIISHRFWDLFSP